MDFYSDLLALLEHLAADGRALFAGKRFYFGCGGGTASRLQCDGNTSGEHHVHDFESAGLEKSSAKASFATTAKGAGFHVAVAKVIEDGRSNIREILLISKPPRNASCKRQKVDVADA